MAEPLIPTRALSIELLRLGSCRFAAWYWLSFMGGWVAGGRDATLAVAGLSFAYWLVMCIAIELLNRVSDYEEDLVNNPERTRILQQLGRRKVLQLAVGCMALCVLGLLAACLWSGGVLGWVWATLAVVTGVSYSFGLRAKRRPLTGLIFLTFPFCGPFVLGFSLAADPAGLGGMGAGEVAALGLYVVLWGGAVVGSIGAKDTTDVAGDEAVGYRSLWVAMQRRMGPVAMVLYALGPYLLIAAAALTGVLPVELAAVAVLAPFAVLLAIGGMRDGSSRSAGAYREWTYHYLLAFSTLWVLLPARLPELVAVAVAAWLYWAIATRWFHWRKGRPWQELVEVTRGVMQRDVTGD